MAKQTAAVALSPEKVLAESLKNAQDLYPQMVESSTKAKIALSKIQSINTPEEDAYANKLLVIVRKTYDKVKGFRTTITGQMDDLKSQLMEPEKAISLEAGHKGSDAWRVKNLRDAYATKVYKEQQEAAATILKEQNKKTEIARIKAELEEQFFVGVNNQLATMEDNIEKHYNSLDLDTYDEKIKKFNLAPKLSQAYYESLFIVEYDKSKLPIADFNALLTEVKGKFTYDNINKIYVDRAIPIVDKWKAKLPEKKTELTKLAELAKTDADAADLLKKETEAKALLEKKERDDKAAKALTEHKATVQMAANVATQDASFEAQVAMQGLGNAKGIKKKKVAVLTCEPVNLVKVLSKVMFACFTNPSFKGVYKFDKDGAPVVKDGNPVYEDWAQTLLDFYASNCDVAIDGVELKEVISTVTKK